MKKLFLAFILLLSFAAQVEAAPKIKYADNVNTRNNTANIVFTSNKKQRVTIVSPVKIGDKRIVVNYNRKKVTVTLRKPYFPKFTTNYNVVDVSLRAYEALSLDTPTGEHQLQSGMLKNEILAARVTDEEREYLLRRFEAKSKAFLYRISIGTQAIQLEGLVTRKFTVSVTTVTGKLVHNEPLVVTVENATILKIKEQPIVSNGSATIELTALRLGQSKLFVSCGASRIIIPVNVVKSSDTTPPSVFGVTNDGYYKGAVSVAFESGATAFYTFNNQNEVTIPVTSGAVLRDEGFYFLRVRDEVGNVTSVKFTIDNTPPRGKLLNQKGPVPNGGASNNYVQPLTDETNISFRYRLNGGSFSTMQPGTMFTIEGRYEVVLTDRSGNETTFSFTIDKTPPVIYGINHLARTRSPVTITFPEGTGQIFESGSTSSTTFFSGQQVSAHGNYRVLVTDSAGNESNIQFFIDKEAPYLEGIKDGNTFRSAQMLILTDGTGTYTRNGSAPVTFYNGTVVSQDGVYIVQTRDDLGNIRLITFTIDTAPPRIEPIPALNRVPVSPIISDATLIQTSLKRNGVSVPYSRGESITADGDYELVVIDSAGNQSFARFTIDRTPPSISAPDFSSTAVTPTVTGGTMVVYREGSTTPLTGTTFDSEGTYRIVATDLAGNEAVKLFTIDRTLP
ncbi:MAG: hypothetical protein ACRC5C_10445, partial [Bacilli bacterium]